MVVITDELEIWLENQVEEKVDKLQQTVADKLPDWFDQFIDWQCVAEWLYEEEHKAFVVRREEAEISAWEDERAGFYYINDEG